jgi:threonine/homoserine/homoserine lactone efflux protein
MTQALMEGLGMGILLSMMIGPVFFTLIQTSLEQGFKHSFVLATGILVSDLVYVLVTYWGVSLLVKNPLIEIYLGFAGGLILSGFSIMTLYKKVWKRPNTGGLPVFSKKKTTFLKGIGVNGFNPFVLLFWISIAGIVTLKTNFEKPHLVLYYGGILGTVFSIDLLKAYVAKQLKRYITPQRLRYLNALVAIALFIFGLRLFIFAYQKLATTPI